MPVLRGLSPAGGSETLLVACEPHCMQAPDHLRAVSFLSGSPERRRAEGGDTGPLQGQADLEKTGFTEGSADEL
jgi:hypothetical protein